MDAQAWTLPEHMRLLKHNNGHSFTTALILKHFLWGYLNSTIITSLLEKSSCFQIFYKIFILHTHHCVVLVMYSKSVWLALLDCTGRKRGKRRKRQEKHGVVQPSFPRSVNYYFLITIKISDFYHMLFSQFIADNVVRSNIEKYLLHKRILIHFKKWQRQCSKIQDLFCSLLNHFTKNKIK